MVSYLSSKQALVFNVLMTDLVHDMISRLYSIHRSEHTHRDFEWSLSSGNLPNFVYNFVRTQDCLLHAAGGPYVMFDLSNSYTAGGLAVFADIHWQLPRTTFSALPTRLSNGEMYRIIPHFADASLGAGGYRGPSGSKDEILYSISKSPIPLQWDFDQECFQAPIAYQSKVRLLSVHPRLPHLYTNGSPQCPREEVETFLSAKVSTIFHDDVRYERVSRYSIKLEIHHGMPRGAESSSVGHSRPKSTGHRAEEDHASWLDPRLQSLFGPDQDSSGSSHRDHEPQVVPPYTDTPQSKTRLRAPLHSQPSHAEHVVREDFAWNAYCRGGQRMHHGFDTVKRHDSPVDIELPSASSGTSVSPSKRKSWPTGGSHENVGALSTLARLDQSYAESDAKRQKLSQPEDLETLRAADAEALFELDAADEAIFAHLERITTGLMGEAQSSPMFNNSRWSRNLDGSDSWASRSNAAYKTHSATLAGTRQTSFTWRGRKPHSDHLPSSYNSAASSLVDDEISAPVTASAITPASTEPLSQEQIQHNYMEFEERRRKKAEEKAYYTATIPGFDGIVSPTDVEDKTFAEIFMGDDDADDWTSDVDGMSVEAGSGRMEE
jgi:hypothetical protein